MLWKQPLTSEWRRAWPQGSLLAISSSTVSATSALRPPLLAPLSPPTPQPTFKCNLQAGFMRKQQVFKDSVLESTPAHM